MSNVSFASSLCRCLALVSLSPAESRSSYFNDERMKIFVHGIGKNRRGGPTLVFTRDPWKQGSFYPGFGMNFEKEVTEMDPRAPPDSGTFLTVVKVSTVLQLPCRTFLRRGVTLNFVIAQTIFATLLNVSSDSADILFLTTQQFCTGLLDCGTYPIWFNFQTYLPRTLFLQLKKARNRSRVLRYRSQVTCMAFLFLNDRDPQPKLVGISLLLCNKTVSSTQEAFHRS